MKVALILVQLCLACSLLSQELVWDTQSYLPKNDETVAIIEDWEGNIVMIGTAEQHTTRKKDLLFWKVSPTGTTITKDYIGSIEVEKGNAITATYDGGYVIAGSTSTKHQKKNKGEDALVVKINKQGEVLWSNTLGGPKADSFQDIVQLENGNLIGVGHKDKQIYIASLAFNGVLLWEQHLSEIQGMANTLIVDDAGFIILAGMTKNGLVERPFVAKMTTIGGLVWQEVIQERKIKVERIEDIILLDTGNYAITGLATEKGSGKNSYVLKIDKDGKQIDTYTFGAQGADGSNALIQNYQGELLCTGFSNSHQRGARRYQLSFQSADSEESEFILYSGNKQNDVGTDLLQASNGDYYITGYTKSSKLTNNNAYLLRVNNPAALSATSCTGLEITEIQFIEESQNDTLETKERGFLLLNICNNGQDDVFGVTAKTKIGDYYAGGINYTRNVNIGHIPKGRCKKIGIPVIGTKTTKTGISEFNISIDSTTIQESATVYSKRVPAPELAITDSVFVIEQHRKTGKRQEKISLRIRLKNIGEVAAENVIVQFSYPYKVEQIGERRFEVGRLPVDSSMVVGFDFFARSYYELDSIQIKVAAWENTMQGKALERFTLKLAPYNQSDEFPERIYPLIDAQGSRGPNAPLFRFDDIAIQWKAPDLSGGTFADKRMFRNYKVPQFDPKLSVISTKGKLSLADFSLLVNGKDAVRSGRIDSTNIELRLENSIGNTYVYLVIYTDLLLGAGDNELVLRVKNHDSEKVNIKYSPPKNSLHVFSIGVPFDNLNYTTKDAQDFSDLFQVPALDELFKSVTIKTYLTKEQTTADALGKLMEEIYDQRDYHEYIKKNDMIMLFISSHGYVDDFRGDFYIVGSEYDKTQIKIRSLSLDFDDIFKELDRISDCKKILFVDACYSAAASGEKSTRTDKPFDVVLSRALVQLAETTPGYNMLLSCSRDEKSHEDKAWENGAFTEALLEAFKIGDENGDFILHTNEIYDYVRVRVPELVKKTKRSIQTPYMPEAHLERDLPLYILKKQ